MACGAVHRQTPKAGARCVNSARRDLCGGYPVTGIPTATTKGGIDYVYFSSRKPFSTGFCSGRPLRSSFWRPEHQWADQ
ncbi:hypothetical protein CU111_10765 [Klebsiella pneumoniae]|nr:hypothetical protein CU111_10765 [Klebsiella pneumoniae]